ncbi:MAG TPA: hypothetical protein VK669_09165 [Candidatus Limnocylindrales bacterium]|nr:hypothetical protein [Candidatus Limnocylindrales bacterium]
MVQSVWGAFAHWFLTVSPGGNDYKEALIAIASVAAVVWTGGLIAMQIRNQGSVSLIGGLDLLQTAFVGPTLALFAVGLPLRVITLMFALFYLFQAVNRMRYAWNLRRQSRPGGTMTLPNRGTDPVGFRAADAKMHYATLTLVSLIFFYIPVILWPSQKSVCIFAWGLTFIGMQMILTRLYSIDSNIRNQVIPYALTAVAMVLLLSLMR